MEEVEDREEGFMRVRDVVQQERVHAMGIEGSGSGASGGNEVCTTVGGI